MINTLMFDIGGTLLTAGHSNERNVEHARFTLLRLEESGINLKVTPEELTAIFHDRSEEYKHLGERTRRELPNVRIWNEYYLRDFNIGEEKLAPIAEELSFRFDFDRMNNKPREGLQETVKALYEMGINLGVISNIISTTFVPYILKEYKIDRYFSYTLCSEEIGIRKPDAAIFQHAMKAMGSTAQTTGYVGDTISRDVLGSRNAGLGLVVQIKNPSIAHRDVDFQGPDAPKPDFLIEKLMELPNIIKTINGGTL